MYRIHSKGPNVSETVLVGAEDMLAKMRMGTQEVYEIKIRGLVIPVRVLSIDEEVDMRNRMIAQNSRNGGDQTSLAVLIQKETLRIASTLGKGQNSMPDRFFSELRRDELTFIFAEYAKLLAEINPSLEQVSHEQFMVLVDAIKKNFVSASDLSMAQFRAVFLAYQDLIQRLDYPTSPEANSIGGQS